MSDLKDSVWGKAYSAPGTINTPENEGTLSVKADGSALYYTRCNQPGGLGSCDLYVSQLDGKGWQRGSNLGSPINGSAWDCQPAISGDGHTLIFSSSRAGGYGGKDLWISYLNHGNWSVPKNLGPAINTREDDDAPFCIMMVPPCILVVWAIPDTVVRIFLCRDWARMDFGRPQKIWDRG